MSDVPERAAWLAVVDALAGTDTRPGLPRIVAPTLVVCGKRDRKCLADSREAAEVIPGAHLLEISHVGHLWPMMAPPVFHAVVSGYLKSGGREPG